MGGREAAVVFEVTMQWAMCMISVAVKSAAVAVNVTESIAAGMIAVPVRSATAMRAVDTLLQRAW